MAKSKSTPKSKPSKKPESKPTHILSKAYRNHVELYGKDALVPLSAKVGIRGCLVDLVCDKNLNTLAFIYDDYRKISVSTLVESMGDGWNLIRNLELYSSELRKGHGLTNIEFLADACIYEILKELGWNSRQDDKMWNTIFKMRLMKGRTKYRGWVKDFEEFAQKKFIPANLKDPLEFTLDNYVKYLRKVKKIKDPNKIEDEKKKILQEPVDIRFLEIRKGKERKHMSPHTALIGSNRLSIKGNITLGYKLEYDWIFDSFEETCAALDDFEKVLLETRGLTSK